MNRETSAGVQVYKRAKQVHVKRGSGLFSFGFSLTLPALIAMSIVLALPSLWGLVISFRDYNRFTIRLPFWEVDSVGLKHYQWVLERLDRGLLESFQITLAFTIISIIGGLVLGLGAALIANRSFKGRTVFRGIMLIPFVLPAVVSLSTLRFMFTNDGIINTLLMGTGLVETAPFWLAGSNTFWVINIGNIWIRWPLFFLILLAALQTIPSELYEAAELDGASPLQKFRYVTFPHLHGVSSITIMLSILWSFNNFIVPYIMLGGGYYEVPQPAFLLSFVILQESFEQLNFGIAAAQSVLMMSAALLFALLFLYYTRTFRGGEDGAPSMAQSGLRKNAGSAALLLVLLVLAFILGGQLAKVLAVLAFILSLGGALALITHYGNKPVMRALRWLALGFYLVLVMFPVYWLFISSIKNEFEIREPTLLPRVPQWQNYLDVWEQVPLARYFTNSVLISGASMLLCVILAVMAGYAISRFRFRGRRLTAGFALFTQTFPRIFLLLPFFLMFSFLQRQPLFEDVLQMKFIGDSAHLGNYLLMILTYTTFTLPFTLWVMRGFIDSIPIDLEEAAAVDGANRLQIMWHIMLPLALPGIATIAILAFLQGWNEVLFSSVLTNSTTRTIALGIQDFRTDNDVMWNLTMTAGVITSLPVIAFFTFLQRYLVGGLTAGSVKG